MNTALDKTKVKIKETENIPKGVICITSVKSPTHKAKKSTAEKRTFKNNKNSNTANVKFKAEKGGGKNAKKPVSIITSTHPVIEKSKNRQNIMGTSPR